MARREQRWAIWKIVLVMIGTIIGAVALFVAGHYVRGGGAAVAADAPGGPAAAGQTLGNMLMLLGAICCGMVVICIGWLVVRYYQSIPAWKKRAKLPAHRRK